MFINDTAIAEIKAHATILEVIQHFVALQKKGRDYKGACPFCNQEAFTVNPAKNLYKCFQCEKGGNSAVSFIMEKEQLDYPAAMQWLADFYNIYLPSKNKNNNYEKSISTTQRSRDKNKDQQPRRLEAVSEKTKEKSHNDYSSFFRRTCTAIGLTKHLNRVKLKWLNRTSQSEDLTLLTEDKEGNIEFLVYDINGFIITYEKLNGTRQEIPYKIIRLKEPRLDSNGHLMKYVIPKGIGTRPFFPPGLLIKFQRKEKITTLCLTEGYKKAISGWINGLDIVGLTSISTYTDKSTMQLHRDIIDLIITCQVENVILLYDGDCRDISTKALDETKDIYQRPNAFFSSARGIKELLKDYLKNYDINLYFAHINSDAVPSHPKGVDDLYQVMINDAWEKTITPADTAFTKNRKYIRAREEIDQLLSKDLFSFSRPGTYFTKLNITFGFQKLVNYLAIDNVNIFYNFHQERIAEKQFIFNGTQYKYNKDRNECEIIIPAAANNYVRVGDDYFELVKVPNKYKELEIQLHKRAKSTITDDYGRHFINHIPKYKAFCNVPDHVKYQSVIHNCFNMYNKFQHEPEQCECPESLAFMQHIFEEQYELGLDYLQLLYQRPTQILPILCLVSKENNTGKSTFAKWLKAIFLQNMAIVGNADLANDFNGFWSTKLIICCEEVFIDKKLLVERIKNLSTADRIIINQKGLNQHEIEFFGHFILLTNNEESFIQINNEDIRYWVRKIKKPQRDNTQLLKELISEIPAFLDYLNKRQMSTENESRMWFLPRLLITEALKRVQVNSRSTVEKELRERLQSMFIDFEENIIYMTVSDIRKEIFNNKYEERYITTILRENMGIDQYYELDEQQQKSYKTRRYSFAKWHTVISEGGAKQEIIRMDIKANGRPFVFLRPEFVPPETEAFLRHDVEMMYLANPVPAHYFDERMLKKPAYYAG
jgi:hypothetical protein